MSGCGFEEAWLDRVNRYCIMLMVDRQWSMCVEGGVMTACGRILRDVHVHVHVDDR